MAKRRRLDHSCNFIGEGDSSGSSKVFSLANFPTNGSDGSQKHGLPPEKDRSRSHSGNIINAMSKIGDGAESSNVLSLQLHDLLEKAHYAARSRMAKTQDVLQELSRIIEQIPPCERTNVRIEPNEPLDTQLIHGYSNRF